ncbi:Asp-tRNA(Asn)/Glu-tRNA(Gln) amidotransferase subunit GatA [Clostridium sp. D2Q-11]|uniref:Glutamyl-tRNA(Gln) amidotransferase subunit A n=1 Tax=Anaeromonas frigoriresistens TaxID=2683708 RepID=A0A942UUD5_9FIRM|nr:Asp-tRNA(Asn)/Glu-tRNA(Gln) amidotransferase subunit GatA [Anaeromonas frigoriresistens]MBS4536996.1 Asp-tRNA(Asn)/Glu-tRNA(Gln) amidotransferase subunit GatA [Anaeromonas frigoriresistens]
MGLFKLTIHELRDKLNTREITSEELVNEFFNRIEATDEYIKSFLLLDKENAIKEAKNIDERRVNGEKLGDLAGIPVAIKDNISTEGLKTTCGSKILSNYTAPYDATVIKNLKEAGAIIVGKTNLDEFAMGSSTENSAFHTTRNPWDLERVPGGSSGGSAAAVAAYQAPFSLGSETGGSVRQPAAFCGVVGLKPTYGLISRYGLVAFASSLDQIGPFTRDVEDCAIVMNTLASHDKLDSTSVEIEKVDYTKNLKKDIKGLKIGVPKEYMGEGISEDVRENIKNVIETFKTLGAEVEEMSLPYSEYGLETYYILAPSEASSNLARFDGVRYGNRAENYNSVEELFTKTRSEGFGEEVKRRIMMGTYCLSSGYYDAYYKKAQKVRTLIKEDFDKAFDEYDVIISPTTPSTAFKIGEKSDNPLDMYASDVLTVAVNIAGIPAISIPCGTSKGLPVGLQIIGKSFDESKILNVAYNIEQKLNFNETPEIGGVK